MEEKNKQTTKIGISVTKNGIVTATGLGSGYLGLKTLNAVSKFKENQKKEITAIEKTISGIDNTMIQQMPITNQNISDLLIRMTELKQKDKSGQYDSICSELNQMNNLLTPSNPVEQRCVRQTLVDIHNQMYAKKIKVENSTYGGVVLMGLAFACFGGYLISEGIEKIYRTFKPKKSDSL